MLPETTGLSQPRYSREALHRQIQLLQNSKQELAATSDARANAYEVKIRGLEATISNLQSQAVSDKQTIAEQAIRISQLQDQIRQALQDAIVALHKDSVHYTTNGSSEIPHAQDDAGKTNVQREVERILKSANSPTRKSRDPHRNRGVESDGIGPIDKAHVATQTDLESILAGSHGSQAVDADISQVLLRKDPKVVICELMSEREILKRSLSESESHCAKLATVIEGLRTDATNLEAKFTSLLSEAEIAITSDRIAQAKIQDQAETIERYSTHVMDLATQIEAYREQINRMADEHRIYQHAQLAKVTISKDEIAKAKDEITTRNSRLWFKEDIVESQRKEAKTQKDRFAKMKEDLAKRYRFLVHVCIASTANMHKDTLIKDLKAKLEAITEPPAKALADKPVTESTVEGIQDAIKLCRQEITRKSALVKHWKTKVDTLEKELDTLKQTTRDLIDPKICETLQAHLRVTRQKVRETEAFATQHADREAQLIKALERLMISVRDTSSSLDIDLFSIPPIIGGSTSSFTPDNDRVTTARDAASLAAFTITTSGKDGRVDQTTGTQTVKNSLIVDVNQADVFRTAQEISMKLLNMDLGQILAGSSLIKEAPTRLSAILAQERFEDDLFTFLSRLYSLNK
eukprot:jgi/Hompol1/4869/HPOL_001851-RA